MTAAAATVPPSPLPEDRRVLLTARLMLVTGTLERQGPVTHLIAARLDDRSELIGSLAVASHDFH